MTRCRPRRRSHCRCSRCCAPVCVPFYPVDCGGLLSFTFTAVAVPATYSVAGTLITLNYTITNTGNRYLRGDLRITEPFLGTQYICNLCVAPGGTAVYTGNYQVTAADIALPSLTFSPVALVNVCRNVFLNVAAAPVVVPRV